MRICYLCQDRGIPVGGVKGASAHVRGITRALAGLGHEVLILASETGGEEPPDVAVREIAGGGLAAQLNGAVPARLGRALGHLWTNVATERALQEAITEFRPAAILERYSPFGVAGGMVARRLSLPHLLEVNAALAWEGRQYRGQALGEAADALEAAAFASTSLIVTVSRELREVLIGSGVPPERIEVVPNGVDTERFVPAGEASAVGPDDSIVVGFVGSLKPWHGLEQLAEAFRELARDPRMHLLVVGEGPGAKAMAGLQADLPGRVTRAGAVPQSEVPRWLRAIDVAVAPYPRLDTFFYSPLKVLEYMAAGRAVVASAIGQLAELIRPGETGLLVPPGDVSALVDAIRELAGDAPRRRALGAAAAREVAQAHRWEHRAAHLVQLVQQVIETRPAV